MEEVEISGSFIVAYDDAVFFTNSDYPAVILKVKGDNRFLIVDRISDLKKVYPQEKYGDSALELANRYAKAIARWFIDETNISRRFIDSIGFQSLYFGGLYKEKKFLRVEPAIDKYSAFVFYNDGEEEYFLENIYVGADMKYEGKKFGKEQVDFMMALHTIQLFEEPRHVYGYTEYERDLPPVPQEVIDGIVKVIPEWKGLKNEEILEKFRNDKWIPKVKSSDDIYALAYAVRKYVAGLIITGKTAVKGDFLEVWKAYEDEMVKELGREDLRVAFNLREIVNFMTQSGGKKERSEVKEISIGL